MKDSKHIISAYVENQPGVLAHVSGLFSSRGFNIQSLAVGETDDPRYSRMTIVVKVERGDESILEQIRKQLEKLINVIKVQDFSSMNVDYVERDLTLIKVNAPAPRRAEIFELVNIFRGKVVDVGQKSIIIELSGPEEKIEAMIALLKPFGIKEMVRTGRIALVRGAK